MRRQIVKAWLCFSCITVLFCGCTKAKRVVGMQTVIRGSEPGTETSTETSTEAGTEYKDVTIEESETRTATKQVADMKVGINIGNTLDSFGTWITGKDTKSYETAWGNPEITRELIREYKKMGFNVIRVPVTYVGHTDDSGRIDEVWLKRVREVVDYCMLEDVMCIINIHHDCGDADTAWLRADQAKLDASMGTRFTYMWEQIAEYFKEYDDRLIFEGFNELLDSKGTWENPDSSAYPVVNKLNQMFVDTVRKSGGNNAYRNLIVNPYGASWHEPQVGGFVLPKDSVKDHLIVSVHFYDPFRFCNCETDSLTENDITEIAKGIEKIKAFGDRIGVPVIIGEFGASDKNNSEKYRSSRAIFAKTTMSNAKKCGIKCIWWDNGADYGLINRSSLNVVDKGTLDEILAK